MEKQRVINAARCAKEWVDMLEENKKRPQAFHELLRNMSQQVIDSEAETLAFNLTDLVDKVEKAESNTAHGKAFSKFDERLEQFSEGLREFAIDHDFEFIPTIWMDKSKRINVAKFGAMETPQEGIRRADQIPKGAIRYTFEEKHQLWRIFGFISGMRLKTWPMVLLGLLLWMLTLGYVAVTAFTLLNVLNNPSLNSLVGLFSVLFVGYFGMRWFRGLDRFMINRITLAHDALANISAPQSVVVMKLDGDNAPIIEVISASSDCPICNGEIRLRKPHFKSSHIVIGACRNNPTEHCFTFDHTTRIGWPISESARHAR